MVACVRERERGRLEKRKAKKKFWGQGFVLLAHAGYEGQGSQVWNRKKELLPTYILQCLMKDTQLDWK